MRIVKRKEFMELPIGTVYSEYRPCCFDGLNIKASDMSDGYTVDFLYDPIVGAIDSNSSDDFFNKCDGMQNGIPCKMDFYYTGREGLFDEKKLYAIFEKEDVEQLIARLSEALLDLNRKSLFPSQEAITNDEHA